MISSIVSAIANKNIFQCLILTLALVLAACAENEPAQDSVSIDHHGERAAAYLKNGQIRAALIEGRNMLQKAPDASQGYEVMAQIYNEIGDYPQTLAMFADVPASANTSTKMLLAKARAFAYAAKAKSATSVLNEINEQDKELYSTEIDIIRARIAINNGDIDSATQIYRSLLDKEPENISVLENAIELYLYDQQLDAAEELLGQFKILSKENPTRLYLLGVLEMQQNKLTAAELHLTEALDLRSSEDTMTAARAAIISQLERLMQQTGRSVEAMAYREQLSGYYGGVDEALNEKMERAHQLYLEEEYLACREILEDVLADYPQFDTPNLMLATLDFRANDAENASLRFIEYIDIELHDKRIVEMAVLSSLAAGKARQLLTVFDESLAVEQDAVLLNARARLLNASGDSEKALASAEQAIELDPYTIDHYVLLAGIQQGQQEAGNETAENPLLTIERALEVNAVDGNGVSNESLLVLSKLYVSVLVDVGQAEKAKAYVDQQLAKSENSASANNLAASYSVLVRDFAQAKVYANESLKKDARSESMLLGLAAIMRELEEPYTDILDVHIDAVELSPLRPESYIQMLSSTKNDSEFEQAVKAAEVLATKHKASSGFMVLSRAYLSRNDSSNADKYYAQAKSFSDDAQASVAFDQAIVQVKAAELAADNDFAGAKKVLEQGIADYGDSASLLSTLIELEISRGNYDQVKELLPRLEKVDASLSGFYDAELDVAAGSLDSALEKYQALWKTNKSDLISQRLYVLLRNVDPSKADDFVTQWGDEVEFSALQMQIASSIAIGKADYETAVRITERLVGVNGQDLRALNNLAWLYQQTGDERALAYAERAYQLAPEQADIIDTYAWVLSENGQVEQAIPLFEKALSLDPDNEEIARNYQAAKDKLAK